ncbi:MAG: extradiol ring-cleavage dioxygenase [Gammaproteobacteria bacterium]|nr:extradiol ring-cleavage dioxygenase [Gammaproteobacteria bacterium]
MSMTFACSVSHTPGITAWADAPPADLKERFYEAYGELRKKLEATEPDAILIVSSEHFANFFLDCMPAFTLGVADNYFGPVEPWLKIEQGTSPGDPELSGRLLEACYAKGFELNYANELKLDHGTMVPLSFLNPDRAIPVVPLIVNCMTYPLPQLSRCYELGRVIGEALEADSRRVAVVAAGGLSHAPGERIHGEIDTEFDELFLQRLQDGDSEALQSYSDEELEKRGLGTHEIRTWITVAGISVGRDASVLFYEPVVAWATGCGLLCYE